MAPIKLEENIREKLQERELQPSKNAWGKLEAGLTRKDEKTGSKTLWFSIAASIAAILIVGSLIFNASKDDTSNEIVIQENTPVENTTKNKSEFIPQEINTKEITVEEVIPEEIISEKPIKRELKPLQKKTTLINEKQKNTNVDVVVSLKEQNTKELPIEAKVEIDKEKLFINTKVEEVVAQVKELKKTKKDITAEEVDELLAKAQLEIQTRRVLDENSQKVNAAALLMDVEKALERSFRDKVFEALGDGYKILRTAVTERNN